MENSYNLPPLYALGDEGQGVTIAIIDSFGSPNMASDLANFDTQMGLPHMCGEPDQPCGAGIPTFTHVYTIRRGKTHGGFGGRSHGMEFQGTLGTLTLRPPPVVRVETQTVAPGPGYLWTPGYWRWTGTQYVWVSGSWVSRPRPAAVWVAGHWVHRGRGWVWVPGHWR